MKNKRLIIIFAAVILLVALVIFILKIFSIDATSSKAEYEIEEFSSSVYTEESSLQEEIITNIESTDEEETPKYDMLKWVEDVKNNEKVITVIALSYCSHCTQYKPIIINLANQNNIILYWFEIDEMESSDAKTLIETFDFSGYEGSSPYTVATNKGIVVGDKLGYSNIDTVEKFLKKINFFE